MKPSTNRTYGIHPSSELVKLFKEKPYQGQDPQRAKVIIIGNDANYTERLSEHIFFEKVLEYHKDGAAFWKKHGKHHPFVLPSYPFDKRLDGVKYHANFQKLLFPPQFAEHISFVELLDIPTIGNTGTDRGLFFELLNPAHLRWLDEILFQGNKKFILVNQTLVREISRINKKFSLLSHFTQSLYASQSIGVVANTPKNLIYNGFSFSHAVSNEYLNSLSVQIRKFIAES